MPPAQTRTVFTIENGVVTQQNITNVRAVRLSDFLPQITSRIRTTLFRTPKNLLHLDLKPNGAQTDISLVIEHPFTSRRISHRRGRASQHGPLTSYLLHFPYIYFIFKLNTNRADMSGDWQGVDWRIFWAPTPAHSLDSHLWPVLLNNCYSDGRICFGNLAVSTQLPLGEYIDRTINTFWTGDFNDDVTPPLPYPSFTDWEAAGQINPLSWNDWHQFRGTTNRTTLGDQLDLDPDRTAPIIIPNTIPDIQLPLTYDRINEWAIRLPDEARARLADQIVSAGTTVLVPRERRG